jgi:plasmid stabilization system protein ParE
MTYRVIIEPTAEREIRAAVRWKTENAAPAVAARWYDGLVKKIETLSRHPSRCPLAAENDKFPEEIRELLYGRGGKRRHRHRILFTIRADAVHILYVRHTARDELEPDNAS